MCTRNIHTLQKVFESVQYMYMTLKRIYITWLLDYKTLKSNEFWGENAPFGRNIQANSAQLWLALEGFGKN